MWAFIMDLQVQLHSCIWDLFVWERINCLLFFGHEMMKKIHGLVWLVFKLHLVKRHYITHSFLTQFFSHSELLLYTHTVYIFSLFSLHFIQFYGYNMNYSVNIPQNVYLFSWPWTFQLCPVFAVINIFSYTYL